MIKVCLVDDESLFVNGLEQILNKQEEIVVSHKFTNSTKLQLEWAELSDKPDIVLMDINIPEVNGIKLTQFILESSPEVKIIGLSSHYTKVFIFKMLKLGASSYLPKNVSIDKLIQTIHHVYNEGFYFDDIQLKGLTDNSLSKKEQQELLYHGLSSRELEVLKLICEQRTTYEIGDQLFISTKTVERHRAKLFEKTKSKNVVGLVLFALKFQLVEKEFVE